MTPTFVAYPSDVELTGRFSSVSTGFKNIFTIFKSFQIRLYHFVKKLVTIIDNHDTCLEFFSRLNRRNIGFDSVADSSSGIRYFSHPSEEGAKKNVLFTDGPLTVITFK